MAAGHRPPPYPSTSSLHSLKSIAGRPPSCRVTMGREQGSSRTCSGVRGDETRRSWTRDVGRRTALECARQLAGLLTEGPEGDEENYL